MLPNLSKAADSLLFINFSSFLPYLNLIFLRVKYSTNIHLKNATRKQEMGKNDGLLFWPLFQQSFTDEIYSFNLNKIINAE